MKIKRKHKETVDRKILSTTQKNLQNNIKKFKSNGKHSESNPFCQNMQSNSVSKNLTPKLYHNTTPTHKIFKAPNQEIVNKNFEKKIKKSGLNRQKTTENLIDDSSDINQNSKTRQNKRIHAKHKDGLDLKLNEVFEGKIEKIMPSLGAIVSLKGSTFLMHKSEISQSFVSDISTFILQKFPDKVIKGILYKDDIREKVAFSHKKYEERIFGENISLSIPFDIDHLRFLLKDHEFEDCPKRSDNNKRSHEFIAPKNLKFQEKKITSKNICEINRFNSQEIKLDKDIQKTKNDSVHNQTYAECFVQKKSPALKSQHILNEENLNAEPANIRDDLPDTDIQDILNKNIQIQKSINNNLNKNTTETTNLSSQAVISNSSFGLNSLNKTVYPSNQISVPKKIQNSSFWISLFKTYIKNNNLHMVKSELHKIVLEIDKKSKKLILSELLSILILDKCEISWLLKKYNSFICESSIISSIQKHLTTNNNNVKNKNTYYNYIKIFYQHYKKPSILKIYLEYLLQNDMDTTELLCDLEKKDLIETAMNKIYESNKHPPRVVVETLLKIIQDKNTKKANEIKKFWWDCYLEKEKTDKLYLRSLYRKITDLDWDKDVAKGYFSDWFDLASTLGDKTNEVTDKATSYIMKKSI